MPTMRRAARAGSLCKSPLELSFIQDASHPGGDDADVSLSLQSLQGGPVACTPARSPRLNLRDLAKPCTAIA